MDVVAGQPVRRGHHDDVQIGQRRVIAQPVQARPSQPGAAIAVIAVDVLAVQLPATLRDRRAQPVKLLLDTLRPGPGGWPAPAHTPPPASGTSSAISIRSGRPPCPAQRTSS